MLNKFTPSINIIRDVDSNIHYIPTPNAKRIVAQFCSDFKNGTRSFNIIGSYGTGKSTFLWAFQQNVLGLKKHFKINLLPDPQLEFINIVGEHMSLKQAFANHFDIKGDLNASEKIFSEIFNRYHDLGTQNPMLFLVIDEFGKFLEYAAENNPGKELYFIQQLAEFVNNPSNNIVLFTTVHQNFDAYSTTLSTVQRHEWTKVKGRFKEITFNEPVEQLLFLASEHLNTRTSARSAQKKIEEVVNLFLESKVFDTNPDYVLEIAEKLYPMDIISANIITTSLQRYGQNERSLFSFLTSTDVTGPIFHTQTNDSFYSLANVYDYLVFNFYTFVNSKSNPDFNEWKSIKTALEQVERVFHTQLNNYSSIIKVIGLLNITAASGSVLNRDFLVAYSKICLNLENAKELIEHLEEKKIILYRNYSERFVLFGGTDLDIQIALLKAGDKVSDVTDITTLLNKYYQLPPIVAKEETYRKGTPRMFEYRISEQPLHIAPKNEIDGFINLIFNDKLQLQEILKQSGNEREAILYGYYTNASSIKNLLFEIEKTKKVIEENLDDNVAVRELNNIITHQHNLLTHKILNNFYSAKNEVVWIFKGDIQTIKNKKDFNKLLSRICSDVYDKAPVFNNELVNKHKISASIHSAKRNYYKALVNNWDKPDLDFPKDKFPPEKTIYLSLLKNNGIELYSDNVIHGINVVEENNFHYLWEASIRFLQGARASRKKVSELYGVLNKRPFKLKKGLIDFWVPSFLFINRDDFALFGRDGYIHSLNDNVIELITKSPHEFEIKTFDIEGVKLDIFNSYRLFLNQSSKEKLSNDTFIETIKPFLIFYRGLPEYSKNTKRLSAEALAIRSAIANSTDPEQTFFESFPEALGFNMETLQNSKEALNTYSSKLQDAIRNLRTCFDALINRVEFFIQSEIIGEDIPFEMYRERLQSRFKEIRKHMLLDAQATFVQRLNSQLDDKRTWLNSLAQALIGNSLDKLDDSQEIIVLDRLKAVIFELDGLTDISKSGFSEEREEVISLEINSFAGGVSKSLVRLPKNKSKEVKSVEDTIRVGFSADRTLNIAALTNLLKELLKNE